jgi:hypothetical protein
MNTTEDPEKAYRRGYHQAIAMAAYDMQAAHPAAAAMLKAYADELDQWRYGYSSYARVRSVKFIPPSLKDLATGFSKWRAVAWRWNQRKKVAK